ncbi:MAG: hypothetical protein IT285_09425 [Bdellovibrionales bacterium]|nr:hypothetical protein [Bdellovibrionales bacterium]
MALFWDGIESLIYRHGADAASRSELAAALAPHFPGITEFGEFGPAFDHAKKLRNVGLVWFDDRDAVLPLDGILTQLGKPAESKGWPCFGVLIRTGAPLSPEACLALQGTGRLLMTVEEGELENPGRLLRLMIELRVLYLHALGEELFPRALQESFEAFAATELSRVSIRFRERLTHLILAPGSEVGLSALETLGALWAPVLECVERKAPSLLAPHPFLKDLLQGIRGSRIHTLGAELEALRSAGSLGSSCPLGKPEAADPVERRVARAWDRVTELAREAERADREEDVA